MIDKEQDAQAAVERAGVQLWVCAVEGQISQRAGGVIRLRAVEDP